MFLQDNAECNWVVENVVPYYQPFVLPTNVIGRHMFWSNRLFLAEDVERPTDFINLANLEGKQKLMDWLGIHYEENIYYGGNHCPAQILRNCVHPDLGAQIFNQCKT
jgi:DNA (cytosine-5)-methyltransferase 1